MLTYNFPTLARTAAVIRYPSKPRIRGFRRDQLCTVLGCERRKPDGGGVGLGRAESINLPLERRSGRRGQDLCVDSRQCRRYYCMRHLYECRESLGC